MMTNFFPDVTKIFFFPFRFENENIQNFEGNENFKTEVLLLFFFIRLPPEFLPVLGLLTR